MVLWSRSTGWRMKWVHSSSISHPAEQSRRMEAEVTEETSHCLDKNREPVRRHMCKFFCCCSRSGRGRGLLEPRGARRRACREAFGGRGRGIELVDVLRHAVGPGDAHGIREARAADFWRRALSEVATAEAGGAVAPHAGANGRVVLGGLGARLYNGGAAGELKRGVGVERVVARNGLPEGGRGVRVFLEGVAGCRALCWEPARGQTRGGADGQPLAIRADGGFGTARAAHAEDNPFQ
mmetsp:Transcript_29414/g.90880  ORF Transcript_29414/g.90880 Transcript_29414/m.90880 type:complete len:238 (+) Transcript_29414:617-1330(+)